MQKLKQIKQMMLTEIGTSVVEIQRKLNVGYVEANNLIQKLSQKYNVVRENNTLRIKVYGVKNEVKRTRKRDNN